VIYSAGMKRISRRRLLAGGAIAGALPILHELVPHRGLHQVIEGDQAVAKGPASGHEGHSARLSGGPVVEGRTVDHRANGFNPTDVLRDFDGGKTRRLASGRVLREWELVAIDKEIEVAPGVKFAAWTYNGRVPGPTLRAREGERLRIHFANGSAHPHTIHFHGIHAAAMDGMPGIGEGVGGGLVQPGQRFTYEFDAAPFGFHHYHCHVSPLAAHIHKGLYGAFIVDPKKGRPAADELLMVMNGFDTNFDASNEVYAVNTVGFHYQNEPVRVKRGELVRIYLLNILEFDQINSFHVHANFFNYYPTGTSLEPVEFTDTIIQGQGQRGILELRFPHEGRFMFHAHKSEFAELGWLGFFEVA
jgi:FtsP/CotA-like multicopper oxidase with cupredoxin domain